jgi:predicted GNAT superfamily acetyltransferase
VQRRLGKRPRRTLTLHDFAKAELKPLYSLRPAPGGLARPPEHLPALNGRLALAEIPPDFLALKQADLGLARDWRFFTRELFETAFSAGYLVTDFVFDRAAAPRACYVLTHGEATLDAIQ